MATGFPDDIVSASGFLGERIFIDIERYDDIGRSQCSIESNLYVIAIRSEPERNSFFSSSDPFEDVMNGTDSSSKRSIHPLFCD